MQENIQQNKNYDQRVIWFDLKVYSDFENSAKVKLSLRMNESGILGVE